MTDIEKDAHIALLERKLDQVLQVVEFIRATEPEVFSTPQYVEFYETAFPAFH